MNPISSSDFSLKLATTVLKVHYLLIAPWIVLSVPPSTVLGQQLLATIVIIIAGLSGTFARSKRLVVFASSGLLAVLIGGKAVANIARLQGPDTAVLLSQFVAVIFLMEMAFPIVDFESDCESLSGRNDELSAHMLNRAQRWLRHQLAADAKLGTTCFLMSLGLLTIGGLASIRVGQLALLAVLVLAAVVALFVLLTYRREPEINRHGRVGR